MIAMWDRPDREGVTVLAWRGYFVGGAIDDSLQGRGERGSESGCTDKDGKVIGSAEVDNPSHTRT